MLKEPPLNEKDRTTHRAKRFDFKNITDILQVPAVRNPILVFFLFTLAVTQMEVVFAIFMGARYGYNAESAGLLLALTGIMMVVVQGGLIGRLTKKYGEHRLALIGITICSIALVIYGWTLTLTLAISALCLLSIGHGLSHPTLSSLTSKASEPAKQGATMGVFNSASSLARVFCPPFAGWLYDHVTMGSPFYAGATYLVLAFLMLFYGPSEGVIQKQVNQHSGE